MVKASAAKSFAKFLVIGRTYASALDKLYVKLSSAATCFFLGIVYLLLPYDYHVLWAAPPADAPPGQTAADYFLLQENNLRFLHGSPPLVSRILIMTIGVGFMGFFIKLYKPSETNTLFDGASLALYLVGVVVYVANIVKGLRMVSSGSYGGKESAEAVAGTGDMSKKGVGIGREDSLKVMAASNTILAVVLVGVLVLQAGQWYAEQKEEEEIAEMDRLAAQKKSRRGSGTGSTGAKKRQ